MKNLKIAMGILVIGILAISTACEGSFLPKHGNGDLISTEKDFSSFEKIRINSSGDVRFHYAEEIDEYRAVITVDSNLEKYTEVLTRNETLVIDTKNGNYSFTKYVVDVYAPSLSAISIDGSGDFSSDETISASAFDARIAGSGDIKGIVECKEFSADIDGSGGINLSGNTDSADINIAGSGDFNGSDFNITNADVRVDGSGNVKISVSDKLDANISGSGDISYRGEPSINKHTPGSGKVRKM